MMKELFERNQAKLTDEEKRRVWQAMTDARKKPRRRRLVSPVPAALGTAALAIFLLVNYVDMDGGRKEAMHDLAAGKTESRSEAIESPGTGNEYSGAEVGRDDGLALSEKAADDRAAAAEAPVSWGGTASADLAEDGAAGAPAAEPKVATNVKKSVPGGAPEGAPAAGVGEKSDAAKARGLAPKLVTRAKGEGTQEASPMQIEAPAPHEPEAVQVAREKIAERVESSPEPEEKGRVVPVAPRSGPQIIPAAFVGSAVGSLKTIRMAEAADREARRRVEQERRANQRAELETGAGGADSLFDTKRDAKEVVRFGYGRSRSTYLKNLREEIESSNTLGEDEGLLAGLVFDENTGRPVVGASAILKGTGRGAVVQDKGEFRFEGLSPGTYAVLVEKIGYIGKEIKDLELKGGAVTTVECGLEPDGQMLETIDVVESAPKVDVQSSSSSYHVDRHEFSLPAVEKKSQNANDQMAGAPGAVVESEGGLYVRGGRKDEKVYVVDDRTKRESSRLSSLGYPGDPSQTRRASERPAPEGFARDGHWMNNVGGTDPVNGAAFDAMFFEHYGVNPYIDPLDDRFATFAVDVDNGSYTLCRNYLMRGALPPKEAVRVEEFINALPHRYDPPEPARYRPADHGAHRPYPGEAFAIHLDAAPAPFGNDLVLLRVGLKGREIDERDRKPANLTLVIDVSGSMNRENRLELVKRSLFLLLDRMSYDDRVAIVVYGSTARTVLPMTSLEDRRTIEHAIASLTPGGSTNAEDGLIEAYWNAGRAWRHDGINRVILCSDGVANVGRTGADDILARIGRDARRGIELTAVGFGMGNYNDVLMEKLADRGDGNYYYVDRIDEARRVFVENLTGTLQTIAKQVKIQVEFDPDEVRRYRLIGYENRDVADEDFRNDKVDAGEIGAGHEVTALFEVRLNDEASRGDLATVRVRHEDPESGEVRERKESIRIRDVLRRFESAGATFRMDAAAAEFAEILRGSYWAKGSDLGDAEKIADRAARDLRGEEDAAEMVDLIGRARLLAAGDDRRWDDEREDDRFSPWWTPNDR